MKIEVTSTVIAGVHIAIFGKEKWIKLSDIVVVGTSNYYPGKYIGHLRIFAARAEVDSYCRLDMKWWEGSIYVRYVDVRAYINRRNLYGKPWAAKDADVIKLIFGKDVYRCPNEKRVNLTPMQILLHNNVGKRKLYLANKKVISATKAMNKAANGDLDSAAQKASPKQVVI